MSHKHDFGVPAFEAAVLPNVLRLIAAVLFFTAPILLPFESSAQTPASPKIAEDLPAGAMQAKATTACLECHEARIILQQRLSPAAWTKEVDKMIKWGAVVDAADRDSLIDYLASNFGPDKPPYEPPRSSLEKAGTKKSK
jgi:hypothetical protein